VVRLYPLVIFSLLTSQTATAISFQTRLEKVEWQVEGDKFECRLAQPIANFGAGVFVRRAGEQATFTLESQERWLGAGQATLLAAAAPWQPGRGDINLGPVSVAGAPGVFNSSQEQGTRLLTGLLEGRSPLVRHRTAAGRDPIEVRLLPAKFTDAYQKYLACTVKLLPVNFDQIRQSQVGFPGGGIELEPMAMAKLGIILDYIKADPTVNRIQLDGHADNSGNRLTNRDVSRRRALAVMGYLIKEGFPAEQITMRFHGERYPVAPNNNPANRAKNRRVTLLLERVSEAELAPTQQAAPEVIPEAAPEAKDATPATTS
jgi:outer membrane protein OmpA-like peptidoglycan-associated protein